MKLYLSLIFLFLSTPIFTQSDSVRRIDDLIEPLLNQNNFERFYSLTDSLEKIHCATPTPACQLLELWRAEATFEKKKIAESDEEARLLFEKIPDTQEYDFLKIRTLLLRSSCALETNDTTSLDSYAVQIDNLLKSDKVADNQIFTAKKLQLEAMRHYQRNQFEEAINPAKKGIAILEKEQPASTDLASLYNDLSAIHYSRTKLDSFLFYLEKANDIYQEKLAPDHPMMLIMYNNLGAAYFVNGESENAIATVKKIIYYYKKNDLPRDRNYFKACTFVGRELAAMGAKKEALERWTSLYEEVKDNADLPIGLRSYVLSSYIYNLSYIEDIDTKVARELIEQADVYLPQIPLRSEKDLTASIAGLYTSIGELKKARKRAESVLDYTPQKMDVLIKARMILARISSYENKHKEALQHAHETLLLSLPEFTDSSYYAIPNQGMLDRKDNTYLRLTEKANYAFDYYQQVSQSQEDLKICIDIAKIIDVKLQELNGLQVFGTGKSHWQMILARLPDLIEMIVEDSKLKLKDEHLELLFRLSENTKVFDLKRSLSEKNLSDLGLISKELSNERKEISTNLTNLKKEIFLKEEATKEEEKNLIDLQTQLAQIEDRIRIAHPNYHAMYLTLNDYTTADIQKRLKEKEYLIDLQVTENQIIALLFSQSNVRIRSVEFVGDSYNDLEKMLAASQDINVFAADFSELSTRLYSNIFQHLMEGIPEQSHLIFAPHGILSNLPFEVLCTAQSPTPNYATLPYLLHKYQISYAAAPSIFVMENRTSQASESIAGFAPIYDTDSKNKDEDWVADLVRNDKFRLPFAEEETEVITEMYNGKAYIGASATRENFIKNAPDYKILHLAMHAHLEEKNPYFSSLLFANDDKNEQMLSVGELFQLNLNTDLCVLSACNTGLGEEYYGRGVISLSSAFTFAGVSSLVYSLWQVPDRQTSQLMQNFYQNIKSGKDKSTALKNAKLTYLDNVKSAAAAHPYYWAGFVLTGKTEPIDVSSSFGFLWLLLMPVVLFLLWRMRN